MPRAGIMSCRKVRNEAISNSRSSLIEVGADSGLQSAAVIPFAISTVYVQMDCTSVCSMPILVANGNVALSIANAVVVACRHGAKPFVSTANEYFIFIGFDKAISDEERAPFLYTSGSLACEMTNDSSSSIEALESAIYVGFCFSDSPAPSERKARVAKSAICVIIAAGTPRTSVRIILSAPST